MSEIPMYPDELDVAPLADVVRAVRRDLTDTAYKRLVAAASWRTRVEASGIRAKCPWTDEMGEISGFGGGYENACREMVYAGLVWLADRTDVDLSSRATADAKALDAALLAACLDCTGAMHGAAMSAVCFIAKQGWAKYVEAMTKRTSESSGGTVDRVERELMEIERRVEELAVAHAMAARAAPGDLCECGHARSAHSLAPACHECDFGWVSPTTQDGCPCERWRPMVVVETAKPLRPSK